MIPRDELSSWLQLLEAPTLGREGVRKLLAAFGSPEAVLSAPFSALREAVGPVAAKALGSKSESVAALIDTTIAWLEMPNEEPRHIVTLGDPLYPRLLLESEDPPLLLYAIGRIELLKPEAVAVVGSRNPTPQGLQNARAFSAHLSKGGIVVVSGLALGIDGAAHEGALEGEAGTIAVVGTGLDRVYPRRHLELARRIARDGLLLSEYSLGAPPLAAHFPQRNRIIAGLARGTLVVEAALQSGSLITARLALESGRDVFAIPGSIHAPQSRGSHQLIKQGAKLVDRAEDILEELKLPAGYGSHPRTAAGSAVSSTNDEPPSSPDDPVLKALGYDPMSFDELIARTGWPAHELSAHLLDLELDGHVARMAGQSFQRVAKA